MSSSLIYKALVNGASEIEITPQDLESLDLSVIDGQNMHVIRGQLGYRVKVVEADYESKTFTLDVGGEKIQIQLKDTVELQAEAMGFERNSGKHIHEVNAPMPGLVVDVRVNTGETVVEGAPLVILEAMKMENELTSPRDGTIAEVLVKEGDTVDKAQVLVRFD